MSAIKQSNRVGKTIVMYEIKECPNFNGLVDLVPMNCFVGSNEIIPGLENDYLPIT